MIKFTADAHGRTMIGLGISQDNIDRLKQNQPIHVNLEAMDLPWKADVVIFFGETDQAMADNFAVIHREQRRR